MKSTSVCSDKISIQDVSFRVQSFYISPHFRMELARNILDITDGKMSRIHKTEHVLFHISSYLQLLYPSCILGIFTGRVCQKIPSFSVFLVLYWNIVQHILIKTSWFFTKVEVFYYIRLFCMVFWYPLPTSSVPVIQYPLVNALLFNWRLPVD